MSLTMPAFGAGGPWTAIRAYGSTVEQASGLPFVNGRAEWDPCLQHVAFGDPVAGLYACTAILVALAARPRLGGAAVDLSQVACLFELGADGIIAAQHATLERRGSRRNRAAPCCVVAVIDPDDWIAVVVTGDEGWRGLCELIGRPEWSSDPALATATGRDARADEIEAAIASWAATQKATEAVADLHAAGAQAAPVQPVHALGADPQLTETGYWQQMDRRFVGNHHLGAPAFRIDGRRPAPRLPAPTLGEHTDEVLAELAGT